MSATAAIGICPRACLIKSSSEDHLIGHQPRLLSALAALVAAALAAPLSAVEELTLHVGRVDGGRWSSGDIELKLGFAAADRVSARLTTVGLELPEPFQALRALSVDCPRADVTATGLACTGAELKLSDDGGGIERLPLAMRLERKADHWRLRVAAEALDPASMWTLAARLGLAPGLEITRGRLAVTLELETGRKGRRLRLDAALSGASFSDAAGLNAGEDLDARLELRAARAESGWQTSAELSLDTGQVYLDPVFVDARNAPVTVSAAGDIEPESGRLRLSSVRLRHRGVASVDGELVVTTGGALEALALRLARAPLAPLYRTYLQPFAVGSVLDALTVDGVGEARLEWRPAPEGWRAWLKLDDVNIADQDGRYSVAGVQGDVEWSEGSRPDITTLRWSGGQFYRIDYGAGVLRGRVSGRQFELEAPVEVPLLEGAVTVNALRVNDIGTRELGWQFRGNVRPMSLRALTGALAWPPFGGTLAGDIPLVSYTRGVISVDGSLDIAVFGGAVRVRQLSISNPFGVIPELRADVDVEGLSLDALTSTFSFGNIQGRLQGRIHGLILKDWKPTAFDARFATPEDDDSRHRISQRAVENLASLGGAGAVLSSTFLRIFDEFSYRRLGIGCRLANGVCDMDGVAPAEQGYYIVEGGGLPPRIDVLGFNRRVDWEVLLGRLRQIVTTNGPVIR